MWIHINILRFMQLSSKSLDAVLDFYITLLLFVKLVFRANLLCAFTVNNNRPSIVDFHFFQ